MPRSVSGDYTLPALNPVVTGTTIQTSWGNNTMDDIATALTGSLSRSGDGGMLAPLKLQNGTAGAPALTFLTETTMGLYRIAATRMGFSVSATLVFEINGTSIVFVQPAYLPNGTVGAPAFTFASDTDTGLYRVGANDIAFAIGGVKTLDLNATSVTYAPDAGSTFYELGFRRLPFRSLASSGSLAATDSGKGVTYTGGAGTITVENLVALDVVTIQNEGSAAVTIAENLSGTMIWMDGSGVLTKVGSRTLAVGGVATIRMTDANNARIWGNGLT